MYTTGELCTKLKTSRQTISNWAVEFAAYLSVTANPVQGVHRRFTDDDLGVLVLVAEMKHAGSTYEAIHASLKAGQRGELIASTGSIVVAQHPQFLALQAALLQTESEVERLEAEANRLRPFEQQAAVEKALRESAEKKLAELENQIRQLYRDLGRLEGEKLQTNRD